jgi:hypothetical protein
MDLEDRARTRQVRAFYPSTTFRVVPLPMMRMGRIRRLAT